MVNDDGIFPKELGGAGTADEADHGYQQRCRRPLARACHSALFLRRISPAEGQNNVNEATA
jgi:hypothetical protein